MFLNDILIENYLVMYFYLWNLLLIDFEFINFNYKVAH